MNHYDVGHALILRSQGINPPVVQPNNQTSIGALEGPADTAVNLAIIGLVLIGGYVAFQRLVK